jgi:ACR3 family arsenite transporter
MANTADSKHDLSASGPNEFVVDTTNLHDSLQDDTMMEIDEGQGLDCFGRYLTLWVAAMMVLGVLVGYYIPEIPDALEEATVAQISIPIAGLIWIMVYPMALQINWEAIKDVRNNLKPVLITSSVNYLVQPFTMYGLAVLFFRVVFAAEMTDEQQDEYIAGSAILGGSPCTAMVFVWSYLTHGDPSYTLIQVIVNDLLIFVFYIPTLMLLLRVTKISIPWDTAFISVALFMVVPGLLAALTQWYAAKYKDQSWLEVR